MLKRVMEDISSAVDRAGVRARLIVCGKGDWKFLDVVSHKAGKLAALECALLHVPRLHAGVQMHTAHLIYQCQASQSACEPLVFLVLRCTFTASLPAVLALQVQISPGRPMPPGISTSI